MMIFLSFLVSAFVTTALLTWLQNRRDREWHRGISQQMAETQKRLEAKLKATKA